MPSCLALSATLPWITVPREDDDADRHDREHRVVAPEWRGLGVLRPVRFEGDLRYVALGRPFGSDQFGAPWRTAMHEHHVRMRGVHLVEAVPDDAMVVEVEAAGEDDLGTGRQQRLGVGAALRGEEVAAVDDGGGEGVVG
jgi:hypothetical protein